MTVVFDAVAAGTISSISLSFSHTATAGAYVVTAISTDRAVPLTSVTYGGVAMTLLGTVNHNNTSSSGATYFYGLANVAAGAKTVAVNFSVSAWVCATAISFTGVSSVSATVSSTGSGSSLSQGPVSPSGGLILQAFGQGNAGSTLSALGGGTNRFNYYLSFAGVALNEAASTTTFTATGGSAPWSGLVIVLNGPSINTGQFFAMF